MCATALSRKLSAGRVAALRVSNGHFEISVRQAGLPTLREISSLCNTIFGSIWLIRSHKTV